MCQTWSNMPESPFELKVTHTYWIQNVLCPTVVWSESRLWLLLGSVAQCGGLVIGRGIGLGLRMAPLLLRDNEWCFPEVCASIRKWQGQLLPLVVWPEGRGSTSAVSYHSSLSELFLSAGCLNNSFWIRQTQNEECSVKNANVIQDEEWLWKCSRLKEAKKT